MDHGRVYIYRRLLRWTLAGVWKNIFSDLIEQDLVDETTLVQDSTTHNVHQHVNDVKRALSSKQGFCHYPFLLV